MESENIIYVTNNLLTTSDITPDITQEVWKQMYIQAQQIVQREKILFEYYTDLILQHNNFIEGLCHLIVRTIGFDLINHSELKIILKNIYNDKKDIVEMAVMDLIAIKQKDPACLSLLNAFVNFKGYKSLQTYRFAHELWVGGRKELGLIIQSKCSELYGVDIHPGAIIGPGLLMDHATGIVIGETTIIGSNCLFYHGVTLGGTGKSLGNRHPKIGDNVIIGYGVSILGNIGIGSDSKIGAGTIVLKSVKPNSIIVGIY